MFCVTKVLFTFKSQCKSTSTFLFWWLYCLLIRPTQHHKNTAISEENNSKNHIPQINLNFNIHRDSTK